MLRERGCCIGRARICGVGSSNLHPICAVPGSKGPVG